MSQYRNNYKLVYITMPTKMMSNFKYIYCGNYVVYNKKKKKKIKTTCYYTYENMHINLFIVKCV